MTSDSGRVVTKEVVVGLAVGVVSILLFLPDIPAGTKVILVISLGIVALLNFLALTGQTAKWGWKWADWKRQRRLIERQDLVDELSRLNEQINQTLYGKTTGRFSLALQGIEAMATIAQIESEMTLHNEFVEKFSMAQTVYPQIHQKIASHWRHPWKSDDFAETMRWVSSHLGMLNLVFNSAYRLVERWPKDKPFPVEARRNWQGFAREYNLVLHDWKAFTERFDRSIGYGTATQAEYVREIP